MPRAHLFWMISEHPHLQLLPPQHTHVWGLLPRTLRVPAGEDGRPGQVFSTSLARPPANERGTSDSVMPSGRDVQEAEMGPELERAESSLP